MPEQYAVEYAILRVVPRVEREEFLNVGVILYSARHRFLQMQYQLSEQRLTLFAPTLELDILKAHLEAFRKVCEGGKEGGEIGLLERPERFRWITSARSTILQTSPVHIAFCRDPEHLLKHLFEDLVL